ncbi:MAG: DUF4357 domain-containing protein [Alphaproteobacteria bacterium]
MVDFNGVYILIDNLKTETPEIYIGKGLVKDRAIQHNKNKDFWTTLFAIRLKDDTGFNDAHNSFLENYFIKKAIELKQSIMNENKQIPREPSLPDEIVSELMHYINIMETLLATLGLKCFQPIENQNISAKDKLYCEDKYGSYGVGEYSEEGFVLYKDTKCKKDLHPGSDRISKRDELIKDGKLILIDGVYVLQENVLFSSVSSAASLVLGRRSNGWLEWKNKNGKTLDELERK